MVNNWANKRTSTRLIRKYLQTRCKLRRAHFLGPQFTCETAAQRHVKDQLCGKPVTNHRHAGAITGERVAAAVGQAQAPRQISPMQQSTVTSFFFVRHAGSRFPLAAGSPTARTPKRVRLDLPGNSCHSSAKTVEDLAQQFQRCVLFAKWRNGQHASTFLPATPRPPI